VPTSARHTHLYTIGSTGSGKSKFLESLIVEDIKAGRGVGLIDPHSDLARDVLAHLLSDGYFAEERNLERVIYFDPTRSDYVLPFNVLSCDHLDAYTITQSVIEAFRRTWPQALAEAPRFTNIATAAIQVLIETKQTLVQLPQLLTNKQYREQLLSQVRDEQIHDYFHTRFDQWGRDTAQMIESVLNKVTAFSFNPHIRRLLGASVNHLNFRRIMDEGRVLIVDLGRCDGETRRLIGSLVVTGIEQAALTRVDVGQRTPFYLFMDEFQDFCANEGAVKTLAQILSECRKYGLYLHLAHQTLGQLHDRLISALGNVGIKVVFTVDREDAVTMAYKLFLADTAEVKHEAQIETQHPVYSPLSEQWERFTANIQNMPARQAWVKRRAKRVVRIRTEPIQSYSASGEMVTRLQASLAKWHGKHTNEPMFELHLPSNAEKTNGVSDWECLPLHSHLRHGIGVIFSRS
jgi:hypothetical protein